ncbi:MULTISPECIES: hypothetical protein [Actinoalloteichus]|nr:hypothetical protein [Actinoalloteichus caeruleus]
MGGWLAVRMVAQRDRGGRRLVGGALIGRWDGVVGADIVRANAAGRTAS